MKIGLRTIKTAIGAAIALLIAEAIGLAYPTSAAIITVLSVTNTKRSTAKTAIGRVLSLTLALAVALICFSILGFNAIAFGLYLLIFIPFSVKFKLSEGIAVSSVLITHFLSDGRFSWPAIANEYLLMIIGVGCALAVNLYMPDTEKRIQEDQLVVEVIMRDLLQEMATYLNQSSKEAMLFQMCQSLADFIKEAQNNARQFEENRFVGANHYYFEYFAMRRLQLRILNNMLTILQDLSATEEEAHELQELLNFTSETLAEDNDGKAIQEKIAETNQKYRQKDLPDSREAFENRAQLFQLFQLFQEFIEIKASFHRQQK